MRKSGNVRVTGLNEPPASPRHTSEESRYKSTNSSREDSLSESVSSVDAHYVTGSKPATNSTARMSGLTSLQETSEEITNIPDEENGTTSDKARDLWEK